MGDKLDYQQLYGVGGSPYNLDTGDDLDFTQLARVDEYRVGWDFGYLPPWRRTPRQHEATERALAAMPRFEIVGFSRNVEKVALWECWSHPSVMTATGGKIYSGNHQLTGSCVGAGGGNVLFSVSAMEVARLNEPEQALVPFWLYPYGRSRWILGDHGRGEGSTGGAFAEACRVDGVVPANLPGLPPYSDTDGLIWGKSAELTWSDGSHADAALMAAAKIHLIKTTSQIKSLDEAEQALTNFYPLGWCGNWGGMMECPQAGSPAVLLNKHRGSWSHQQSCQAMWHHPTLGRIWYILNQWGLSAHGTCPSGAPRGGYWIQDDDMAYQIRGGEVIAFSQFMGFPAQELDYYWIRGRRTKGRKR